MRQFILMVNDLAETGTTLQPVHEYLAQNQASAILIHAFLGDWHMEPAQELRERILRELPDAVMVGGISCGEIFEGNLGMLKYLVVVSVFEHAQIRILSYQFKRGEEIGAGQAITDAIDAHPEAKAVEILTTPRSYDVQVLIENIRHKNKKLPIFGAGIMGLVGDNQMAFVLTQEGLILSGAILVIYEGADFHVHLEHVFGWEPMGREMVANKAGHCVVQEIDGKPAYEIYRHYLQIPRNDNFLENTLGFPFLTQDRGVDVLRVSHACTEDGQLLFSAEVPDGSRLRLTYGNLSQIFKEVEVRQERLRQFAPQAILLYDCATRRMFWQSGVDQELHPFQEVAPTAGFFCEGEFKSTEDGILVNHQCTLVIIGMREGEKGDIPPASKKIEELKFYADASILKRMANFIQMTTVELEEANRQLTLLNRNLSNVNAKLSHMAVTDELTQLFNRREIVRCIKVALQKVQTAKTVLSLIMIDIDFFKKVNDTYGHAVGDLVLKEAAAVIHDSLDEDREEIAGRWGGEEFLVLLPSTTLQEAANLAEEIRRTFANHVFPQAGHQTLSLGVTCTYGDEDENKLFIRVDDALYRAKTGGRNQVVVLDV